MLDTIPGNTDGITFGIDFEIELGSLYGCFDGSNDCKLEGILIGGLARDSLGSGHGSRKG